MCNGLSSICCHVSDGKGLSKRLISKVQVRRYEAVIDWHVFAVRYPTERGHLKNGNSHDFQRRSQVSSLSTSLHRLFFVHTVCENSPKIHNFFLSIQNLNIFQLNIFPMSERFLNSFKSGGESFSRMRHKVKKMKRGRQSNSEDDSLGSNSTSSSSSRRNSSRSLASATGAPTTVAPRFSPEYWNERYGKSGCL